MKQLEAFYLSLLIHCSLSAGFRNFGFYLGERGEKSFKFFSPAVTRSVQTSGVIWTLTLLR